MSKKLLRKLLSLGIISLLLFPQWIAYATDVIIDDPTPDLKAPLLNNINVSSNELSPTNSIKVIAEISDILSGFNSGYIIYKKPNNQTVEKEFVYNSTTNKYEATLTADQTDIAGEWRATTIYLKDKKDNDVTLHDQTIQHNGEKVDFSNIHLNVSGVTPPPEPTDKEAPLLHDIFVTSQQVNVNENIEIKADITDNETGVSYIYAVYKKPSGSHEYIYLNQNSEGQFTGTHTIGKYEESGDWLLTSLYVSDRAGNSQTYTSYLDNEDNQKNFEHCKVNVSGTIVDNEAPKLVSISVESQQVQANEQIKISAQATDNESGAASIRAEYEKPDGSTQYAYLYKNSDGVFSGTISIGQYEERGNWILKRVYLADAVGNNQSITSYEDSSGILKDFTNCTVEITGTTPDKEGPEIVHREISVEQISSTQAAVKLAVEVKDDISGITYSSLSGTYSKPSGRTLNVNFKKNNSLYTATILIDKFDETGTWTFQTMSIRDWLGNENSPSTRAQNIAYFSELDFNVMGKITVTPGSPESIDLDVPTEMNSGQTLQLKPMLKYSNPAVAAKDITNDNNTKYSSTKTNLLAITSSGLMSVPSEADSGNVFVEVSYGEIKKQFEVKINGGSIESVLQVTPLSTILHAGKTEQMKVVEVYDGARKDVTNSSTGITYTSSNPSLVTISKDGLIQAVSGDVQGSAIIQVKYNNMVSQTNVKVTKPVATSLAISPAEEDLSLTNNKLQFVVKAIMSDGTTRDVTKADAGTTYTSSNKAIAQVSPDGYVSIPADAKSGTVTITVNSNNLLIKSVLHVTGNPDLVNVNLDSIPSEINIGEQVQLSFQSEWSDGTVKEINLADVTFNSSRSDRVTISAEGLFESFSAGTSEIVITYEGKTFSKTTRVLPPASVTSIYLENPLVAQMKIGDKSNISGVKAVWSNGIVTDLAIHDLKFSSSRPDRVSVNTEGLLTAISSGSSNITIEYNGLIITASVKVEAAATILSIELETPIPAEMKIGQEHVIGKVRAKWTNGDVTEINSAELLYLSTRSDRLSVNADGKLNAISSGSSYVDVIYKDKTIRTAVKVTAGPTLVGITLGTPLPVSMKVGEEYTISNVKAKWSNGEETILSNSALTFTSSRSDRISITADGKLKAISVGTSNISIYYSGYLIQTSIKAVSY
ncbi:Ig-like domain-containing protein [Fictibacillus aquaticus]|uniref:BIG2 domain-containing protein n=1 Tax=Fictibacillus aquaticus TaxID=2021314 RepID=A0A235FEC1_9BACL|nr:Ig-like domain-containing protein [Fictibacillus aquaticus]OYD59740.1 hypothetical protein CGZ90_07625 [Fictibacillus aquaticus]